MKDDIFKPMLATDADLTKLRFPLLASPTPKAREAAREALAEISAAPSTAARALIQEKYESTLVAEVNKRASKLLEGMGESELLGLFQAALR